MNKNKFSVIIPVLHEEAIINSALNYLAETSGDFDVEIVVVDCSSEMTTINSIAAQDAVVTAYSEKGRGKQMNKGADVAVGNILIFLHADTLLPHGAFNDIENVLSDSNVVGGAFDLAFDRKKLLYKIIASIASLRSRISRIPYGDQGIFIRSDYFKSIGGYSEAPLMEDIDLMRRVKSDGRKIVFIPKKVKTSARRWEKNGIIRSTMRNWILQIKYFKGVNPEELVKEYYKDWKVEK